LSSLDNYIWFEKYRPSTLKELSLHPDHRAAFTKYIEDGDLPHLLLEGPAGSGKTTVAYILKNHIPSNVLLLNASGADRGVDTVKVKIKQFACSQPQPGKIKIVLLDEADSLTKDAQTALRNTMETYSKNCKFIMTCNYVDKIIDPLQSRCIKFTFDRFPRKKLVRVCSDILKAEGIDNFSKEELAEIVDMDYPDMRSIINNLQSACISGELKLKSIGSRVKPKEVEAFIRAGKLQSLRQHIAGVTDFMFLYRWFFDDFVANNQHDDQNVDIVRNVVQAISVDPIVADREIIFVGCCMEIMEIVGAKPNFSK